MALTARDVAVLCSVWQLRCLTRAQIQRLHFGGDPGEAGARASSVCIRRLGLLREHGYLRARRIPTSRAAGPSPYLYSLGPRAFGLVAEQLGLEPAEVVRRSRQDARLSWLFYEHRALVTDLRIALMRACQQRGYALTWVTDEETVGWHEQVEVGGRRLPLRPDAFVVIRLGEPGPRTACFIELQRTSKPAHFRVKVEAYMAYWASGGYAARVGMRSLRVLTVAESLARCLHLKAAVEALGGSTLFWFTPLDAVLAEPFGSIWLVGGYDGRYELLSGASEAHQTATAGNSTGSESGGSALISAPSDHKLQQARW